MIFKGTFHLRFLLCVAVMFVTVQAFWSDCDLVTIVNSKSGIVVTDLKVTRFNRTANSISGTVKLITDLNDGYDCEMKAYYSSNGDSKYTLLPYKVARDACCLLLESKYWKTIENRLQETSNIPQRKGDEPFCFSLKENVYEVRQFAFDQSVIPMFMQAGTYKLELLVYEKTSRDISSISAFIGKLY